MSVIVTAGATALMRMPSGAELPGERAGQADEPGFGGAVAAVSATPIWPSRDAMFTIYRCRARASMAGRHGRVWKAAVRSVRMTSSQTALSSLKERPDQGPARRC